MKIQSKQIRSWVISAVLVILFLLSYRFLCGVGLEKVYSEGDVSIYMPDKKYSVVASRLAGYVNYRLSEIDKDFEPNYSIYFCKSLTEFHIKALSLNTPLASNRVPFKSIFVRPIDFDAMAIAPRKSVLAERKVRDVMVHEVVHCYEWRKLGAVQFYLKVFNEKWKIEGFSEYVAGISTFSFDKGISIFVGFDSYDFVVENEVEAEYFYFVSRLRTDYLLGCKKISIDEYWSTKYDEKQLDDEIRNAIATGAYQVKL